MISDYLDILSEENLKHFKIGSYFIVSNDKNDIYLGDYVDRDTNTQKKLPSLISEIGKKLVMFGVVEEFRRTQYNPGLPHFEEGHVVCKNINYEKLGLLEDILKKSLKIDYTNANKLITLIKREGYIDPGIISDILNISKNDLVYFNDAEILIHAIFEETPEKILILIHWLSENYTNQENVPLLKQLKEYYGIDKSSDTKSNIDEVLFSEPRYECLYNSNGNFKIDNFSGNIKDLDSNSKNGVAFFFTIVSKGYHKPLEDYMGDFINNRKEYFHFKKIGKLSIKTFKKDHPSRFNNFAKKNNIHFQISNDSHAGITINRRSV